MTKNYGKLLQPNTKIKKDNGLEPKTKAFLNAVRKTHEENRQKNQDLRDQ